MSYVLLKRKRLEDLLDLLVEVSKDERVAGNVQYGIVGARKVKSRVKFLQVIYDEGKLGLQGIVIYNMDKKLLGRIAQRLANENNLLAFNPEPNLYWVKEKIIYFYEPERRRYICNWKKSLGAVGGEANEKEKVT